MIAHDQPIGFDSSQLLVGLSSADDGTMSFSSDAVSEVSDNRQYFLDRLAIDPLHTALVQVTYDTTDFTRYAAVDDDQLGEAMLYRPLFAWPTGWSRHGQVTHFSCQLLTVLAPCFTTPRIE